MLPRNETCHLSSRCVRRSNKSKPAFSLVMCAAILGLSLVFDVADCEVC